MMSFLCDVFTRQILLFKLLLLLVLVLYSFSVAKFSQAVESADSSITLESLIDKNQLSIEIRVQSKAPFVVKQPIIVQVEVSSDRWFSKGVHVTPPAYKDIVFLPTSSSSITGTKKINGQTWTYIIREITLYPMQEGVYELPAFDVFASVNTEYGIVEGVLKTDDFQIEARMPQVVTELDTGVGFTTEVEDNLIVSPSVTLSVKHDIGNEVLDITDVARTFNVGDAVTQTVSITAKGVPAMMLPVLAQTKLSGLSVYQQPSKLSDKSNRGELTGIMSQTTSYIFEQAGEFTTPKQVLYWYNLQQNEVTELTVPSVTWVVKGGAISASSDGTASSFKAWLSKYSLVIVSLFILIYVLTRLAPYRTNLKALYLSLSQYEIKQLQASLRQEYEQGNYAKVCQLLYRYIEYQDAQLSKIGSAVSLLNHHHSNERGLDNSHLNNDIILSLKQFYKSDSEKYSLLERLLTQTYSIDTAAPLTDEQFNTLLQVTVLLKYNQSKGSGDISASAIKLN
ncbi:hypothetical protein [Shewanella sp. ENK2]|uniref:hypothetical protein n=1 Tax=Shewanella sp. ENK2 TaxID=2775245 RepID=UPI003749FA12